MPPGSPLIIAGTQAMANMYGFGVDTLILVGWEELSRTSGFRANEKMFHILIHLVDALKPEEVHFCMERKKAESIPPFSLMCTNSAGKSWPGEKRPISPPTRGFFSWKWRKTRRT